MLYQHPSRIQKKKKKKKNPKKYKKLFQGIFFVILHLRESTFHHYAFSPLFTTDKTFCQLLAAPQDLDPASNHKLYTWIPSMIWKTLGKASEKWFLSNNREMQPFLKLWKVMSA